MSKKKEYGKGVLPSDVIKVSEIDPSPSSDMVDDGHIWTYAVREEDDLVALPQGWEGGAFTFPPNPYQHLTDTIEDYPSQFSDDAEIVTIGISVAEFTRINAQHDGWDSGAVPFNSLIQTLKNERTLKECLEEQRED